MPRCAEEIGSDGCCGCGCCCYPKAPLQRRVEWMRRLDEDSDETDQLSSSVCPATMAGRRRTSPDLDPLSLSSLVIEAAMSVKHRDRAEGREGGRTSEWAEHQVTSRRGERCRCRLVCCFSVCASRRDMTAREEQGPISFAHSYDRDDTCTRLADSLYDPLELKYS